MNIFHRFSNYNDFILNDGIQNNNGHEKIEQNRNQDENYRNC